jgi:hypothetical protein
VIVDMLDLQERIDRPLVDLFTETDNPEGRIDIVRAFWNEQMDATRNRLRSLRATATRQKSGGYQRQSTVRA